MLRNSDKIKAAKFRYPVFRETVNLDVDVFVMGIKLACIKFNEFNYLKLLEDINTNQIKELDLKNKANNCMRI